MSQQLVKKGANGKHENVMPRSWIEAIKDKNTGQTLVEILQGFNMYFLSYSGNPSSTRNMVPTNLRKKGLWITYVNYDGNVCTEWYGASKIDDESWGNSSNWRVGNNTLVGDITISANGNWVINGAETEFKAIGEKGNTPLLRVANNRLQVSYDLGDTYTDVTSNPVYTKFRWLGTTGDTQNNILGRIQSSTDDGKTWTNMSNDFTNNLHISRYIGVNESLPTSGIAEGTIYAKGPYYAEDDTLNDNPIYRLWVYAWKDNTLAWQDNGEFQSIAAGIAQTTGDSETLVMSQKAVTEKLSDLGTWDFNIEYLRVYTDKDNKFLWGIKKDGSIEWKVGIPTPIKKKLLELKELINAINVDAEIAEVTSKVEDLGKWESNVEYLRVYTDKNNKFLWGIKADGSIEWQTGVPTPIKKKLLELKDSISAIDKIVEENKELVDSINELFMTSENNPEYIDAVIDANGKILESRKWDGTKVFHTKISAKEFILPQSGWQSLYSNLKPYIKNIGTYDYTDYISNDGDLPLMLPIPSCAYINITGVPAMPTTKTANSKVEIEYMDGVGNYFKKKAIINAQGNSSLADIKKNVAVDFFDSEFDEDALSIKFGDWVAQDSFHIKAYYSDTFCGIPVVGYKLYDKIIKTRDFLNDRTWKRALLPTDIGTQTTSMNTEDVDIRIDNGAKCFPDGFPVLLYLNGEFYGIFAWQLKKHRDNYHQSSKKAKHIHIDGNISEELVWEVNGAINWDKWSAKVAETTGNRDGVEVRNPKNLICVDGTKYDFDTNAKELIDENSANYDASNSNMVLTNNVKKYLVDLTKCVPTINSLRTNGADTATIKSKIEEYFDVSSIIDYVIFSDIIGNYDGVKKNWQWTTYDGKKWFVNPYDLDWTFGYVGSPEGITPRAGHVNTSLNNPYGLVVKYYTTELEERYKLLRDKGIIDAGNITNMLNDWVQRIGINNYELENSKWTEKKKDNMYRFYNWVNENIEQKDTLYNYNK